MFDHPCLNSSITNSWQGTRSTYVNAFICMVFWIRVLAQIRVVLYRSLKLWLAYQLALTLSKEYPLFTNSVVQLLKVRYPAQKHIGSFVLQASSHVLFIICCLTWPLEDQRNYCISEELPNGSVDFPWTLHCNTQAFPWISSMPLTMQMPHYKKRF